MRTGKELLIASNEFAVENRLRSWWNLLVTAIPLAATVTIACLGLPWFVSLAASLLAAMLLVRLFIIYHDYEHGAIFRGSQLAKIIVSPVGILLLSPPAIWKGSHDDHHKNNAKKFGPTLGTFPVVSTEQYAVMSGREKFDYLITRHPLTIAAGYLTIFMWELSLKSFLQEPKRNLLGLVAVLLHAGIIVTLALLNVHALVFAWLIPMAVAMAIGSYLFYAQHNFPGMKVRHGDQWDHVQAALVSSSFMRMNRVMHWLTGNIGFHHVHHLNAKIPFYRLPEAMAQIEELQSPGCTSLNPLEIIRCLRLKLWDSRQDRLVALPKSVAA